jgi:hypothetical protein
MEVNAQRDRETYTRLERDHFFTRSLPALHLTATAHDVPDLLDRPVGDGSRHLAGSQLELGSKRS